MERIIETYINDFAVDLKGLLKKLNVNGIKLDNPILSDITISITDEIDEQEMNDTILGNTKTAYSPYTNTIYIDENFVQASQLRYHLTKRLLECISTRKKDNMITSGVSLISGNRTHNKALNDAITENITNLMLFDSSLDEDAYKYNIIARKNLAKIESIVGMDTILRSYFNSDYIELESKFDSYADTPINEFKNITRKMDRLKSISYEGKNIGETDKDLAYDIDRILIHVYAQKILTENIIPDMFFKEHIVTSETVRSEFGDSKKHGYENVDKNSKYYDALIKGLENRNELLINHAKNTTK